MSGGARKQAFVSVYSWWVLKNDLIGTFQGITGIQHKNEELFCESALKSAKFSRSRLRRSGVEAPSAPRCAQKQAFART